MRESINTKNISLIIHIKNTTNLDPSFGIYAFYHHLFCFLNISQVPASHGTVACSSSSSAPICSAPPRSRAKAFRAASGLFFQANHRGDSLQDWDTVDQPYNRTAKTAEIWCLLLGMVYICRGALVSFREGTQPCLVLDIFFFITCFTNWPNKLWKKRDRNFDCIFWYIHHDLCHINICVPFVLHIDE